MLHLGMLVFCQLAKLQVSSLNAQYYMHLGCTVIHNFLRTNMTFVKVSQFLLTDSDSQ